MAFKSYIQDTRYNIFIRKSIKDIIKLKVNKKERKMMNSK